MHGGGSRPLRVAESSPVQETSTSPATPAVKSRIRPGPVVAIGVVAVLAVSAQGSARPNYAGPVHKLRRLDDGAGCFAGVASYSLTGNGSPIG